jgi:hypothetical protein
MCILLREMMLRRGYRRIADGRESNFQGNYHAARAVQQGFCAVETMLRRSLLVPVRVLAAAHFHGNNRPSSSTGAIDLKKAKATRKTGKRREWTKADLRELKDHSKARTPVVKISKLTKRSVGALRQKALHLGIGLGHRR